MKINLVSVIVTTRNEERNIANCLKSIKQQSYKEVEVIVVDNNSTDKTKEIARKFTKNIYNKGPERSAQRNYGAKKSKGEFLLFLDCDMILSPKVVEACVKRVQSKKETQGIIIPEESIGEGFWAKCKRLERSFYVGIDWMEAARFFKQKIFEEMNGYDEKNTGTEDYDLPQRIMLRYGKKSIDRIEKFILHNEGELSLLKTLKKKYYYAQNLERYSSVDANKKNFTKQANPLNRYTLYFSDPIRLFKNPVLGAGMIFMKSCEFLAGFYGYVKVGKSI